MEPQTPIFKTDATIETPLKDIQTASVQKIENPETIKIEKKSISNIRFTTVTGIIILLLISFLFVFIPWPECAWFRSRSTYPNTKLKNCPKSVSIWQLIQFSINDK
jgi:hypothetical protein